MKLQSKQLQRLAVLRAEIKIIISNELRSVMATINATTNRCARIAANQNVINQALPLTTKYYTQISDEYGGCPISHLSAALAESAGYDITELVWNAHRPKYLRYAKLAFFTESESEKILTDMAYIQNNGEIK